MICCLRLFERKSNLGVVNSTNENNVGNTLLDINLIDFTNFNLDNSFDYRIKDEYIPINNQLINNEFINDFLHYSQNIMQNISFNNLSSLNNRTLMSQGFDNKTKTFIFSQNNKNLSMFAIDNTLNVYFHPPETDYYLSLYSSIYIKINNKVADISTFKAVYNSEKK